MENNQSMTEKLVLRCVGCQNEFSLNVPVEGKIAYANGVKAQDAFPTLDEFERECLISGFCFDCQERIFHKPTKAHAKVWGEKMGSCPVCDAGVYREKDRLKGHGSRWKCGNCLTVLRWDKSFDNLEEDPEMN